MSNLFFFGGVWSQTLILGWLVYDLTGSSVVLAVFSAVRLSPMLLGPLAGVVADRVDRAWFMLMVTGWAFTVTVVLALLATIGHCPVWVIIVCGFCIGLAQSPAQPARSTLVLDIVGRDNLANANALNAMVLNMTQVIGPATGGAMISGLGPAMALWLSAAWYLCSLALIVPIRSLGRASRTATRQSVLGLLTGGIRVVLTERLTATVLLITVAANLLIWPLYQTFMPVVAKDLLGLDAAGLGWLLTCAGAGGLLGSLILSYLGDFKNKGGVFVFGTAVWGGLWALFALSRSVPLSLILMACIGLASAAFGVLQTTLMLMSTEPAARGRALGLLELAIGTQPLAALLLGAVVDLAGIATTTLVCGVLLTTILLITAIRVPQLLRFS